jgi:hypothetical protein
MVGSAQPLSRTSPYHPNRLSRCVGSDTPRSIRPTRAKRPADASVDQTEAAKVDVTDASTSTS